MLLLTGPPGSGKSHAVLEEVRSRLGRGGQDFRLLAPTATMAEHLRNQMAREGFVFSPDLILTFSKFTGEYTPAGAQLPAAALKLAVRHALETCKLKAFQNVATLPGFETVLTRLILDCSSAGCDSVRLLQAGLADAYPAAFGELFGAVETALRAQGYVLRGEALRQAAARIRDEGLRGIRAIFFDGFFQLAAPELAVIAALARHADITMTLPAWSGADLARKTLRAMGFEEQTSAARAAQPRTVVIEAPSLVEETEEIARRILSHVRGGGRFREIGIVVRAKDPYGPALRMTLERFGIPARFYFGEPAAMHPAVRYLAALVGAMLSGWDHERTLSALRRTHSGLGATPPGDAFDFDLRERIPGRGLAALRSLEGAGAFAPLFDSLAKLDEWRQSPATPGEWAKRCRALPALVAPPRSLDPESHEIAAVWRSLPAALRAFEEAMEETAASLDDVEMPFAGFWQEAADVLKEATLRVPDRRRDVVHVIDVYEARQWALPVVFVCGLLEKQFPRYYPQDPIFPESIRRRLQALGIRLRTTADLQAEENFLFDLATSRATAQLFLSYPKFNAKGDENVRSFLLDALIERDAPARELSVTVRPAHASAPPPERRPEIHDEALRAAMTRKHAVLGPTSIESYLQCPYQFFARHTLKLDGAPPAPRDRLAIAAQGTILHRVLSEWVLDPTGRNWRDLFDRVFEDTCRRERIPGGYRTESIRLELLGNLARFVQAEPFAGTWPSEVERPFHLAIGAGFAVEGKIDRVLSLGRQAVVIDYKYSAPERIRQHVTEHEAGLRVQGGLYLLAAEEVLGLDPAGFLYCGLKKNVTWKGWHTVAELEAVCPRCDAAEVRNVIETARQRSIETLVRIGEGRILPEPADEDQCEHCAFVDICRWEVTAKSAVASEVRP